VVSSLTVFRLKFCMHCWSSMCGTFPSYLINFDLMPLIIPTGGWEFFSSPPALGPTQPPIQWIPGSLFLGIKRPGREADHSPRSSAEVKEWVELYLRSLIRLLGMVLSRITLPLIIFYEGHRLWGNSLSRFHHFLLLLFSLVHTFSSPFRFQTTSYLMRSERTGLAV
jgi:hypothetical protein